MKNKPKGTIYKIINIINDKVYIGQTIQDYKYRFIQHKSHAKTYHSNHKLANAIRKYGETNFIVEPIEYCSLDKLDEREQYWIKYYNSVTNGYNTTWGGQKSKNFYILDNEEEIIEYYYQCHNQQEVCKKFNITEYKFRQILARLNLPTDFSNYGKHIRKQVKVIELNMIFNSERECAKYFIDNNLCKTKKEECAFIGVSRAVKQHKKYCNYTIIEF